MVSGDRQHAAKLRQEVAAVLAPLGLRLAPEKTRVVHIDEGFDFLGYHIRRMRKRGTDKYYVCTKPARKAIKDKVKAKTYSQPAVKRYRYRSSNIPTPWTPEPAAATSS
jgi:RNA-directed DNA polymerase